MADTGFVFPGTAVGNRAVTSSTSDWVNPDNIKADDSTDSQNNTLLDDTEFTSGLAASNFDFSSIAAGATIDGIEIQNKYKEDDAPDFFTFKIISLILADDSDGSVSKHSDLTAPISIYTTDEAGGASDLWSETISDTDVKDVDWGWFQSQLSNSSNGLTQVDFMRMKVYYTVSGPEVGAGSLTLTGVVPFVAPSIKDVNSGSAWTDGDTNINIDGQFLV